MPSLIRPALTCESSAPPMPPACSGPASTCAQFNSGWATSPWRPRCGISRGEGRARPARQSSDRRPSWRSVGLRGARSCELSTDVSSGSLASFFFQSPLHRGGPFNGYAPHSCLWLPLFQSPLHRGGPFNLNWSWRTRLQGIISVPSSSGRSLQQNFPVRPESSVIDFSPLFIGEVPST